MKLRFFRLAVAGIFLSAAASAHHSFAMFDSEKEITIEGTIKEFQWTNPHAWIQVMVPDAKSGQQVEWSIEGSPTTSLKRRGWSRESLLPGDKVVVTINPLRSGSPGGALVKVSKNGQLVGGMAPK